MNIQVIIKPIFQLDTPAGTLRGGICSYAISIKFPCSSPRYHSVSDLASSSVRTVTEINLSQTSVRRCHGSWKNSPHKDDFAFIRITSIHQCLVTGKFNIQKITNSLSVGHRNCDLYFKRYYFRGLSNRMCCFVKMKETQAQLYKKHAWQKCHKHTPHTISWRQEDTITESHRLIKKSK